MAITFKKYKVEIDKIGSITSEAYIKKARKKIKTDSSLSVADIKKETQNFKEYILKNLNDEHKIQKYLEKISFWLGFQSVKILPQFYINDSRLDFLIKDTSGNYWIYELKRPDEVLFKSWPKGKIKETRLTKTDPLKRAIEQACYYKEKLVIYCNDHDFLKKHKLNPTIKNAKIRILIGYTNDPNIIERLIMENSYYNGIEIFTYSSLVKTMKNAIKQLESLD